MPQAHFHAENYDDIGKNRFKISSLKTIYQSTERISSVVEQDNRFSTGRNSRTKIFLMATLIPLIFSIMISYTMYKFRRPSRCRRTNDQPPEVELRTSIETITSGSLSSQELYTTTKV